MPDSARHVAIIELDDVVPRRVGDRANLLVMATVDREAKVAALQKGRGRPKWARGQVVRLRADLADARDTELVDAQQRLRALGYTVNRDRRLWRVYVVELQQALDADSAGRVYVGETAIDVADRIEQHRSRAVNARGPLYSRVVARDFLRRRPDLEPLAPLFNREQARAEELATAERLSTLGFEVLGGH